MAPQFPQERASWKVLARVSVTSTLGSAGSMRVTQQLSVLNSNARRRTSRSAHMKASHCLCRQKRQRIAPGLVRTLKVHWQNGKRTLCVQSSESMLRRTQRKVLQRCSALLWCLGWLLMSASLARFQTWFPTSMRVYSQTGRLVKMVSSRGTNLPKAATNGPGTWLTTRHFRRRSMISLLRLKSSRCRAKKQSHVRWLRKLSDCKVLSRVPNQCK